jgi:hypothetical protein
VISERFTELPFTFSMEAGIAIQGVNIGADIPRRAGIIGAV